MLRTRAQVAQLAGDRKAEQYIDELLAADPDDRIGHVLRGNLLVERATSTAAVRHFEHAARLDPSDHDLAHVTRFNRTLTHWSQWPIYPIQRFGPLKVWGAWVAFFLVSGARTCVGTSGRSPSSTSPWSSTAGRSRRSRAGGCRGACERRPDRRRSGRRSLPRPTTTRCGSSWRRRCATPADADEALAEYDVLLAAGAPAGGAARRRTRRARLGRVDRASDYADRAAEAGLVEGVAELRAEIDRSLGLEGTMRLVRRGPEDDEGAVPLELESDVSVTFGDIGGLDEVKKTIHRTIVLPFQRPELYERYGRRAGGGILLFGPPGCGKTLLARATAGECRLPFSNVRIEEILDPYFGVSERNLHETFEQARALRAVRALRRRARRDRLRAPEAHGQRRAGRSSTRCSRSSTRSAPTTRASSSSRRRTRRGTSTRRSSGRAGSTACSSCRRPTATAREQILALHLRGTPGRGRGSRGARAKRTPLFSGADLRALVERAVDARDRRRARLGRRPAADAAAPRRARSSTSARARSSGSPPRATTSTSRTRAAATTTSRASSSRRRRRAGRTERHRRLARLGAAAAGDRADRARLR